MSHALLTSNFVVMSSDDIDSIPTYHCLIESSVTVHSRHDSDAVSSSIPVRGLGREKKNVKADGYLEIEMLVQARNLLYSVTVNN